VLVLGLTTATPLGGVALVEDDRVIGAGRWRSPRSHGPRLWAVLNEVLGGAGLTLDRIDLIAVCVGPGSFTGLRVGLAAAQGLALALGRPVIGLDSLWLLAAGLPWARRPVRPVVDVRRGLVATALFDTSTGRPRRLEAMESLTPAEIVARAVEPVILVGDGLAVYADQWPAGDDRLELTPAVGHDLRPEAVAWHGREGHLAGRSGPPQSLRPVYARPPDALAARSGITCGA
jgi:tRNA threonylcarbamoyladenosine biosynthesis protein TsaB